MHFIKNVPIVIAGAENTQVKRSACDNSTFSHYHSCDLYAESATNTIPVKEICPLRSVLRGFELLASNLLKIDWLFCFKTGDQS